MGIENRRMRQENRGRLFSYLNDPAVPLLGLLICPVMDSCAGRQQMNFVMSSGVEIRSGGRLSLRRCIFSCSPSRQPVAIAQGLRS